MSRGVFWRLVPRRRPFIVRFFGPSFLVLWLSQQWGITTAYAATPSEEALLAHYLSYEEDPDVVRFVYEELQRAATPVAYDEALRSFLKAGMLLELKGKKRNDFTAPLCPDPTRA